LGLDSTQGLWQARAQTKNYPGSALGHSTILRGIKPLSLIGIRAEKFVELALDPFELVGVGRRLAFPGDVRPLFRIFPVELDPFLQALLGIRQDGIGRAFRLADAAIDAF